LTIGERIREVRKSSEVNLTLKAFGEKIGSFSSGTMSAMESGSRAVTDRTIQSICREFHVSETWLRTGEGEMFVSSSQRDRIYAWVDEILAEEPESYKVRLAAALAELDEPGWEVLYGLAVKIVAAAKAEEELEPDVLKEENATGSSAPGSEELDEEELARIEAEADMVRESYIETAKRKRRSLGSSGGGASTA